MKALKHNHTVFPGVLGQPGGMMSDPKNGQKLRITLPEPIHGSVEYSIPMTLFG